MINPELLQMLCCPESHADLILASQEQLEVLNEAIKERKIKNRVGRTISEPIEGALIRADYLYAYSIKQGIPIMLIDEALPLSGVIFSTQQSDNHHVREFSTAG